MKKLGLGLDAYASTYLNGRFPMKQSSWPLDHGVSIRRTIHRSFTSYDVSAAICAFGHLRHNVLTSIFLFRPSIFAQELIK